MVGDSHPTIVLIIVRAFLEWAVLIKRFQVTFLGKVHSNYCQAFRAVRDFDSEFGFKSETTYNKKGDKAQFYNFKFIHFGTFVFHLSQLCGIFDIRESLKKSFSKEYTAEFKTFQSNPLIGDYCQAFQAVRNFDSKFGITSETISNKKGDKAQFYNLQFWLQSYAVFEWLYNRLSPKVPGLT